jgi:glycosyltransferase involved in cell wall biosynthesis
MKLSLSHRPAAGPVIASAATPALASAPSPHPQGEGPPLKVLLASLFHPELVRGGAQQIAYELFQGLQAEPGIEPTFLAAVDTSFAALYKTGARITGFDGRPGEFLFLARDYDYIWHKTASALLIESYVEFLLTVQPDVVHFHHFLLFGVDIISVTRRVLPQARIIFTFHEFMAICSADGQMVRRNDGSLCSHASPVRCHQCFPERGPDSFFLREAWMKQHLSAADELTVPSPFMIDTFVRWGLDRTRLHHISNGQRNRGEGVVRSSAETGVRFGFFGQMLDNKGVHVILQAVELLRAEGFEDFAVELNGGNMKYASEKRRAEIEAFLAEEAERPLAERRVVYNGPYEVDQIGRRMGRVDWVIVPSIWPEAFGLVISEARMFGRPVIGSRVGAIADRVRHEVDGLLVEPDDPRALADAIRRAATEPELYRRLAAASPPAETRDGMVHQFCQLYRSGPRTI